MVAQLIPIFIFAISIAVDLNGIICQVDEVVLGVLELIVVATRPDVPLAIPVPLDRAILHHIKSTRRTSSM